MFLQQKSTDCLGFFLMFVLFGIIYNLSKIELSIKRILTNISHFVFSAQSLLLLTSGRIARMSRFKMEEKALMFSDLGTNRELKGIKENVMC